MNNYAKLIVSMSANLMTGIIKKNINDKYENNMFSYQLYNAIVSLFSAVVLTVFSENLSCSFYTIILAVIFGLTTLIQQITNLYALEKGPFSYTAVIISLSSLIPTLSGALFWNENISFIQYVAIILMVICLILSVNKGNKENKASVKWLIFCFAAFICTGLIGVMQKIHQSSDYKNELDAFLVIAFLVSFILSSVYCLLLIKGKKYSFTRDSKSAINLLPVVLMGLSGVFVALNNKFNLYLSGVIDAAIFFPVVNGGGLVLNSFVALIVFKEKLTLKQWIGLVAGIISVIMICDVF